MALLTTTSTRMIALALTMSPTIAFAGNFATCLLDKLPGVQNDSTAMAINKLCLDKYPDGLTWIERGSGRGFLSYDSGAECAAKKGASTPSNAGGRMIFVACNVLYNKPIPIVDLDK